MSKSNSNLSERGNILANNPARVDDDLFAEACQNLYCPDKNPNGSFPLNVAENHLMGSIIKSQLGSIIQQYEIPDWVLNYTNTLGHPEIRTEIAKFMELHLCKCSIPYDTIGLSAGASAIIEVSSFMLANPGDVAVIPAPSYPMYTNDLGVKSGIVRFDLQTHFEIKEIGSEAPVKVELLDKTWDELKVQGKCFKLLVLSSPDNPTGCIYTEHELRKLANWCIQHEVHMIVNEIYGLSLIDTQDDVLKQDYSMEGAYSSFAKLMNELNSDYLHLWYAFSKDFAMSGLRIGIVHSLNKAFMKGLGNVNIPHMVSNFTQWLVGAMLKNTDFIEEYILENKKRLTQSYKLMVTTLRKHDIPYVPSRGGFFLWMDLSKYLYEDSDHGEKQLWLDLYENTGVLLTPGIGFQHQKKGLFRIVYTAISFAHLEIAMDRMANYLISREASTDYKI